MYTPKLGDLAHPVFFRENEVRLHIMKTQCEKKFILLVKYFVKLDM